MQFFVVVSNESQNDSDKDDEQIDPAGQDSPDPGVPGSVSWQMGDPDICSRKACLCFVEIQLYVVNAVWGNAFRVLCASDPPRGPLDSDQDKAPTEGGMVSIKQNKSLAVK